MDVEIKNGGGGGYDIGAHVDGDYNLHTLAIVKQIGRDAVRKGNAYNINTGTIGLTSATESAVLYFKNDEPPSNGESGYIIEALAIGIDDEGTTTGMSTITLVRNPTGGTIVSGASAVSMKQNRNFGSSNELSSTTLAYKGAEGNTLTGGDDFAIFYQQPGTRGYYEINIEMPKGSSLGVKIDTDTSSGTSNVYVALIGHRVDGNLI